MGAFRTVSERVFPETHKRLLSGEPGLVKAQEDRRDVPGNHRLGRDKGVLAQGDVADDGGVSAYVLAPRLTRILAKSSVVLRGYSLRALITEVYRIRIVRLSCSQTPE
jgi:hypothetical protein